MIGVIDYEKQCKQYLSHKSQNAICYLACYGTKWPGCIEEGNGVKIGETVEMRVDRKNGTIKWMMNGEVVASWERQILVEKKIVSICSNVRLKTCD